MEAHQVYVVGHFKSESVRALGLPMDPTPYKKPRVWYKVGLFGQKTDFPNYPSFPKTESFFKGYGLVDCGLLMSLRRWDISGVVCKYGVLLVKYWGFYGITIMGFIGNCMLNLLFIRKGCEQCVFFLTPYFFLASSYVTSEGCRRAGVLGLGLVSSACNFEQKGVWVLD